MILVSNLIPIVSMTNIRNILYFFQTHQDALKWRRSEDIRNLKPTYFPDDLFKISSMFIYAPDKEGNNSNCNSITCEWPLLLGHQETWPFTSEYVTYFEYLNWSTQWKSLVTTCCINSTKLRKVMASLAWLIFKVIPSHLSHFYNTTLTANTNLKQGPESRMQTSIYCFTRFTLCGHTFLPASITFW